MPTGGGCRHRPMERDRSDRPRERSVKRCQIHAHTGHQRCSVFGEEHLCVSTEARNHTHSRTVIIHPVSVSQPETESLGFLCFTTPWGHAVLGRRRPCRAAGARHWYASPHCACVPRIVLDTRSASLVQCIIRRRVRGAMHPAFFVGRCSLLLRRREARLQTS